jgi:hypothetical protein
MGYNTGNLYNFVTPAPVLQMSDQYHCSIPPTVSINFSKITNYRNVIVNLYVITW